MGGSILSVADIKVSIQPSAWPRLRELPPHSNRRESPQQFTGYTYVPAPERKPNARGLSDYIASLLFKYMSPFHSPTAPYDINPSTFIDNRQPFVQQNDYALYGEPGKPTEWTDETIKLAKGRATAQYTIWFDPDCPTTEQHGLVIPNLYEDILPLVSRIVAYWHISTPGGCFPHDSREAFSGFLNAVGLNLLTHPLIQENAVIEPQKPSPESINAHYEEIDKHIAILKTRATKHTTVRKFTSTRSKKPCQTLMDGISHIGTPFTYKCSAEASYVLVIGAAHSYVCELCSYERTKNLPHEAYQLIPIADYVAPARDISMTGRKPNTATTKQPKKLKLKAKDQLQLMKRETTLVHMAKDLEKRKYLFVPVNPYIILHIPPVSFDTATMARARALPVGSCQVYGFEFNPNPHVWLMEPDICGFFCKLDKGQNVNKLACRSIYNPDVLLDTGCCNVCLPNVLKYLRQCFFEIEVNTTQ